ncbi:MAG TPA: LuxR C-terminal-related transcriptional regulator [Gracilimonas sp.]|uniref:response regulator transcription factor n=1 Tax=Gracilimonas sp. TaxID=1974203 RepID=UPI002D82BF66|nr:LuxR C-terminal-related transcriptional regulator [Gracilimonas sp.]
MRNLIWIFGVTLGLASLILKGIELYYSVSIIPTELYIGIVAVLFIGSAIWIVNRFTSMSPKEPGRKPFKRNEHVFQALDVTAQELKVLKQLAKGRSNQEIADELAISTNKVKNTLSRVYKKLEVDRRSMAVKKAKSLKLIS